ncbi:winged helix-turn-helix domain-containing protein [Kitasatospora purpeofusca]|uniref:winged helix-turn-helix domain-containing protein n=1 Tax=Kitasatospora purpeofusca TaxID=67352 RepID=UPI0036C5A6C7
MALRIHFTGVDLTRLVLAPARIAPASEIVLSLQQLQNRNISPRFAHWRQDVIRQRSHAAQLLSGLIPKADWFPSTLTPARDVFDSGEAAVEVLQTLTDALTGLASARQAAGWRNPLLGRSPVSTTVVGRALVEYQALAITPYARSIRAQLETERTIRSRLMASRGIEALITSLHPATRWNASVMEIPSEANRDIYLRGRGLTLVGQFFSGPLPRLVSESGTPILAYPVAFAPRSAGPLSCDASVSGNVSESLVAMLGRTRSAVLQAVADTPGMTTSGLAERVRISVASASEHATVLRKAGLIASHRQRATTLHSPTSLGIDLIDGADPRGKLPVALGRVPVLV